MPGVVDVMERPLNEGRERKRRCCTRTVSVAHVVLPGMLPSPKGQHADEQDSTLFGRFSLPSEDHRRRYERRRAITDSKRLVVSSPPTPWILVQSWATHLLLVLVRPGRKLELVAISTSEAPAAAPTPSAAG